MNYVSGGTQQVASGNTVRAIQPLLNSDIGRELQAIADEIAKSGGTPIV